MLGTRGPRLEVVAGASFLTEPVSCEVSNAVGSANRSTALDVLCELGRGCGCGQRWARLSGLLRGLEGRGWESGRGVLGGGESGLGAYSCALEGVVFLWG